jgi:putative transposase
MAKSICDAGWAMLRRMLLYKGIAQGVTVEIVSERLSSATCSAGGARSGPKGIAGLRIRQWVASVALCMIVT